jgi:hypothetical protein
MASGNMVSLKDAMVARQASDHNQIDSLNTEELFVTNKDVINSCLLNLGNVRLYFLPWDDSRTSG